MNHTYKMLKSDIELFTSCIKTVRVYVVQPLSGDLIDIVDYGGVMEKITPEGSRLTDLTSLVSSLNLE